MPNLCWNCHLSGSGHFGSGDNLSTEKGVTVAPAGAPTGYPTVNSRFIERSCRTCHVKVHGSNHPSGAFQCSPLVVVEPPVSAAVVGPVTHLHHAPPNQI
jgi:polygalacturonase